jgi:hypothetical protein
MLDALRAYLVNPGLPDDPLVTLNAFELDGSDAVITLRVMDYDAQETRKRWMIRAVKLRDYDVREAHGELELAEPDHVLARQHTDTCQTLSFSGKPQSVLVAMGELLVAHRRTVSDWIPFERYLNAQCDLAWLLATGFGTLADGPSFLVKAYADALENAGIEPSLLPRRPAKCWDGAQWVTSSSALYTLLIGESFFVAEAFQERELLPED